MNDFAFNKYLQTHRKLDSTSFISPVRGKCCCCCLALISVGHVRADPRVTYTETRASASGPCPETPIAARTHTWHSTSIHISCADMVLFPIELKSTQSYRQPLHMNTEGIKRRVQSFASVPMKLFSDTKSK